MTGQEKAFLDMLAWSEHTSDHPLTRNSGYDVIVNGPKDTPTQFEVFTDYANHPFALGRPAKIIRHVPLLTSTASGRYQLLLRYWRAYQGMLNLTDFSPASQDAVALRQMKEQGACAHLADGDVEGAIKACKNIWASLPGNGYGQRENTMDELLEKYQSFLDSAANSA